MNHLKLAAFIFTALMLSACASQKVSYGDATAQETVNEDFGSTDLQTISAKMVDDMLSAGSIVAITANKRPIVFVDRIKNKTTEHIDFESVTDTIQTKLINSGKFRFVDVTALEQVKAQFDYQKNSGLVDQSKAVAVGRQVGAEMMLYGNMSSIVKTNKKTKDVYYKFTLKLLDLESGIVEWQSEKEIRKSKDKKWFSL